MAVDFNIEIRKKQLESLDQFVTCSRDEVQSILKNLGWSVLKIQEEQRLFAICPHNENHKVPAEKIEDHVEKCIVKSSGYDLQEEFISEPVKLSEQSTIKIDTNKKIEILCQAVSQKPYFQTELFFLLSRIFKIMKIAKPTFIYPFSTWNGKDPDPQTFSRLLSTFSSDERLVLYDYSVANTQGPEELPEFDTSIMTKDKGNSSFSNTALKSFERDIKRRSVKYKPIHTNHKNYKEVLREVINSQMQQYNDWLENINGSKGPHTPENNHLTEDSLEHEVEVNRDNFRDSERPHSSVSKFSNNSGSSYGTKYKRQFLLDEGVKYRNDEEYSSKYSDGRSKSKYKHIHHDEDSQESNSISKISLLDIDSSCENNDNTSRAHSRDSSIHSSHGYKEKRARYKESRRRKSRSGSRDRRKRDHSSGSSRHSSRSHRSKDDRFGKRYSREKSRRHKDPRGDT